MLSSLKDFIRRVRLRYASRRWTRAFSSVETFCLFIGYPRSGHSLVGSLLDAHEEVIISHELDVLRLINDLSEMEIFYRIYENSKEFTKRGRKWEGYSYLIDGLHNGRFTTLRVIGDKKGGKTLDRIHENPEILQIFRQKIQRDIKFVHVIRNPFDIIGTEVRETSREQRGIDFFAREQFRRFCTIQRLKNLPDVKIFDLRLESLIRSTKKRLDELCSFLDLETNPKYLVRCDDHVFDSPNKSRFDIDWPEKKIQWIQSNIGEYSFLEGYTYSS